MVLKNKNVIEIIFFIFNQFNFFKTIVMISIYITIHIIKVIECIINKLINLFFSTTTIDKEHFLLKKYKKYNTKYCI